MDRRGREESPSDTKLFQADECGARKHRYGYGYRVRYVSGTAVKERHTPLLKATYISRSIPPDFSSPVRDLLCDDVPAYCFSTQSTLAYAIDKATVRASIDSLLLLLLGSIHLTLSMTSVVPCRFQLRFCRRSFFLLASLSLPSADDKDSAASSSFSSSFVDVFR
ncbi:hypothetical protein KSP40_PGU000809 [Platanthera guangdongensis]|uniref:Uncharacterized protein n=1 Tax=Platanthera guangdongensis TaxID=2320717 RepID=A0ABR2MMP2_9ASPA